MASPVLEADCLVTDAGSSSGMSYCINKTNGYVWQYQHNTGGRSYQSFGNSWPAGWTPANTQCSWRSSTVLNILICANNELKRVCQVPLQTGPYNWNSCWTIS